jgi:hypothetical protein
LGVRAKNGDVDDIANVVDGNIGNGNGRHGNVKGNGKNNDCGGVSEREVRRSAPATGASVGPGTYFSNNSSGVGTQTLRLMSQQSTKMTSFSTASRGLAPVPRSALLQGLSRTGANDDSGNDDENDGDNNDDDNDNNDDNNNGDSDAGDGNAQKKVQASVVRANVKAVRAASRRLAAAKQSILDELNTDAGVSTSPAHSNGINGGIGVGSVAGGSGGFGGVGGGGGGSGGVGGGPGSISGVSTEVALAALAAASMARTGGGAPLDTTHCKGSGSGGVGGDGVGDGGDGSGGGGDAVVGCAVAARREALQRANNDKRIRLAGRSGAIADAAERGRARKRWLSLVVHTKVLQCLVRLAAYN